MAGEVGPHLRTELRKTGENAFIYEVTLLPSSERTVLADADDSLLNSMRFHSPAGSARVCPAVQHPARGVTWVRCEVVVFRLLSDHLWVWL